MDAAVTQLQRRFGPTGWGGAAAMRTAEGSVLTSVAIETLLDSAALCIETGAIAEAHKRAEGVIATVCVVRDEATSALRVLAPCGLCQERLRFWGPDVEAAVGDPEQPGGWAGRRLGDLQPHWWGRAFGAA